MSFFDLKYAILPIKRYALESDIHSKKCFTMVKWFTIFSFQLQILCKIFLCGPLWPWNPTSLLITWYDLCVTKLQSVLCNLALSAEKYKPDVKNIWLSKEKMYVVYIIPGKECNKLQNQSKKNSCSTACKLNQSGNAFIHDDVPMAWGTLFNLSI